MFFGFPLTIRCCRWCLIFAIINIAVAFGVRADASNLVVSTPTSFSSLDGSASDDDGMADGTLTIDNLIVTSTGSIYADDPAYPQNASACNIRIVATVDISIEAGGSITAENRICGGCGGNITLIAGGGVSLLGGTPGALVSSRKRAGSWDTGHSGNITIQAGLALSEGSGATITAGQNVCTDFGSGGAILLTADSIDLAGEVSSRSGMPDTCWYSQPPGGGPITAKGVITLSVDDTGVISSRGLEPGADLVHLEAAVTFVGGIVESTGPGYVVPNCPPNHLSGSNRPGKPCNSTAGVEVWADFLDIDGDVSKGEINADTGNNCGNCGTSWIDLFARTDLEVFGPSTGIFAVHANGLASSYDDGGLVAVKCVGDAAGFSFLFGHGQMLQADATCSCGSGGCITVESNLDIDLEQASLFARGDFVGYSFGYGGHQSLRAFNGLLTWNLGVGDVRPTGTAVPSSRRGTITLTAPLPGPNTTGSTFPSNGLPTTPTYQVQGPGGSPSLPGYVALPTL